MAARENQGLQIALILFVMVTVVLGVTTYMYFRKSEEKIKEAAAARADKKQTEEMMLAMQFETQALKHMLGYDTKTPEEFKSLRDSLKGKAEMENIISSFEQDMARWGAGLQQDQLNYRALPDKVVTTLAKLNNEITDKLTDMKAISDKHKVELAAEQSRTKAVEDRFDKQEADYSSARKIFNTERSRVTDDSKQIAQKLAQQSAATQQLAAKSQEEIAKLQKDLQNSMNLFDEANKKLNVLKEESKTERPSGRIEYVNQAAKLVWLDLGQADGVQRAMTFSVIDRTETGVTKAKVKGKVEITKILNANQSEARIIKEDSELTSPIMKGDLVYSPAFKRGQKTHFALLGVMDLDGDGKSDRERIKSIIALNNGVVDAEMDEDGTIIGKITLDTNYIVQGQKPDEKTSPKLTKAYSEMDGEATRLGKTLMPLKDLLDRMGYSSDQRVVPLKGGGTGGPGTKISDTFKPRSPVAGGKKD